MARGPGKYDAEATKLREETNAVAVMVLIVKGDKGSGFSVQTQALDEAHGEELTLTLADMLRNVADQMTKDVTS